MADPRFDIVYTDKAVEVAAFSRRWAALAKLDVDVATIGTWDRSLPRDKRILVPIDVQAFVVPDADAEATVPVAGGAGDPAPFDDGAPRPVGVHLHWAMPDALLRGAHVEGARSATMPALPDRWVVVRTLLPVGGRLVHTKGWVIDSAKGSVTTLSDYSGATNDAADGVATYSPLDGTSGGTLLWSATYEGARNRFTLHDDLADLPALAAVAPQGFHAGRACYTVAGWWSDGGDDPLATARSRPELQARVAGFGWHISPEAPDDADAADDPRLTRLRVTSGLSSPPTSTPVHQFDKYRETSSTYSELAPMVASPVAQAAAHYIGVGPTRYHSLLHGSVLGVPVGGVLTAADDRPPAGALATSIGLDLDDVTAALAAPGFGASPAQRQGAERLMAAFTSGMLARITTPDGVRDIEEREHADGFWSFAGAPLAKAVDDRLRAEDSLAYNPTSVGRKGRGALATSTKSKIVDDELLATEIAWNDKYSDKYVHVGSGTSHRSKRSKAAGSAASRPAVGQSRTVSKPAPRMFRPAPPIVAVRGLKPNARHHGDGLFDPLGLRCRWPGECTPGFQGVIDASQILPTLGNGAIPTEVLTVVREAVTLDPYSGQWLARAGQPEPVWKAREARVAAEHIRLYGADMTYDGSGASGLLRAISGPRAAASSWSEVSRSNVDSATQLSVELANFSYVAGATPSPVAITTWRQPWVPLYVEWKVRVRGRDTLDAWALDGLDLDPAPDQPADTVDRTFTGRSPISTGIAKSLGAAMTAWLDAENARDAATPSQSQLSEADEASFAKLRDLLAPLDLVSTSLDGIREQLLGIEYLGGAVVRQVPADDPTASPRPVASELPVVLFGGRIEVLELRALDAFGRTCEIPVTAMRTTATLEVPGAPSAIAVSPRVQHGARWLFRLIDPGHPVSSDPADAREAFVDQMVGDDAVTPISGFVLPDHMDESLEFFDRTGTPIGELIHDAVSDAVTWEPAPGRPVPPDAGPMTGIPGEFGAHAQHAGLLAAGLIRADIENRHSGEPATRSALSALLRAIDTTLWSIDTFQAIGSPTIAGLVGRPVALVRATLRLDVPDDVDEVLVTQAGGVDARRAVFETLATMRFPVRIGDLGRSDDSVLGFFVDDDYTRFHIVDKVVASHAFDSGRHRGHLGLLGQVEVPATDEIAHTYIEAEDTLLVKPGQVLRLTILMLPAGKVHLTTGIVPRKALALADDWVTPGLRRLVPSLRVGPVLVDPAEIHLPKVASLGEDQNFIRRTGPLTWKEDPIIAATSAALLPKIPHEVQEGWIRVAPSTPKRSADR
jgi:hypothetical protein